MPLPRLMLCDHGDYPNTGIVVPPCACGGKWPSIKSYTTQFLPV